MEYKDLRIVKNTTQIYELVFEQENGQAQDITGWTIYFTVKVQVKDPDSSAVISQVITTHSDPLKGKTLIELTPDDTDITAGNYYHSVDFKNTLDQTGVLFTGKLKIQKAVRADRS